MRRAILVGGVLFLAVPLGVSAQSAGPDRAEELARLFSDHVAADLDDPAAELQERIESGEVRLDRDPDFGYLPAVLEALDIPVSSQVLVFSRTSLQVDMIAPWAPRAIYFNDDVYVGYTVDGLVLEIASVDPDGGSVFYTVDQRARDGVELRADDLTCKGCHDTGITGGVSGVMMRSYLTDRMGNTVVPIQERPIDDRTPMAKRFGGWYVTGSHTLAHAGNTRGEEMVHEIDQPDDYLQAFDVNADGNVLSLADRFEESFYLTTGSDIVALLVLAHQTRVHNLITLAAEAAAGAMRAQELARLSAVTTGGEDALAESEIARLDYAAQSLVRGMLFYRAEPIGRVEGTSGFAADFEARGPRDSRGRSLRDFALNGRLFEHPLSFLVYSDAWDALPPLVKDRAYRMIHDVLTGDDDPDYPLLDSATRRSVFEILVETKPDFAELVGGTEAGS